MKIQLKTPVDRALKILTKQQHNVISLRYGLEGRKKLTLQEIADDYSLTRERIRQIQNFSLKKLGNNECIHTLSSVVTQVENMLRSCGGISSEESLCVSCNLTTKVEQNYLRLLLDLSENFFLSQETDHAKSYWYISDEDKKRTDRILDSLHKKFESMSNTVLNKEQFEDTFKKISKKHDNKSKKGIQSYAHTPRLSKKIKQNMFNEWGLSEHPEIALANLSGYIRVILRDAGKPLHFSEVTKRVSNVRSAECNSASCHNELVRNDHFVLVGRGLYALKEMGYKSGTIYDVIVEGLEKNGPMTREEVLDYVLKRRHVQENSIILALYQKENFGRDNDKYFLKKEQVSA